MLNIKSNANRATEHDWFAWKPVLAVTKGVNGHTYRWVWLKTVRRRYASAAGIGQWAYEIA